jgi:hypothetical protein
MKLLISFAGYRLIDEKYSTDVRVERSTYDVRNKTDHLKGDWFEYRVILSVLDPRKCEYLKDY